MHFNSGTVEMVVAESVKDDASLRAAQRTITPLVQDTFARRTYALFSVEMLTRW
jgi:hypothetical protein